MSATNRGSLRRANDNYQTPEELAEAFLACIDWSKITSVMEPCRGAGNIYNSIPAGIKKYWCEIDPAYTQAYPAEPRDYLKMDPWQVDATITNPPYGLATEFIQKALQTSKFVAMLTRLNFWGSRKRLSYWKRWSVVDHQLVVVPRPSFTGGGSDATEYAWLCWDGLGALDMLPAFAHLEWDKQTHSQAVLIPSGISL